MESVMGMKEIITITVVVVVLVIILAMGYIKAPTDQAVIISGLRKKPKIIIGRSSIRIPFLQRVDKLSLKMLSVDVKTSKTIPTLDYINIMVDSVATIKISTDPEKMDRAAENFLNKNSDYINMMVVNVLEGNLREIIGGMKLVDIMNDRKAFATAVQTNATSDMAAMGLEIVSFNIQNIDDAGLGVIENLGIANTVAIRQNAEVSRANAEKEIAVAQAVAKQQANVARVESETAIAIQNNELSIKQADLKREADTKQAEADAAYEIQRQAQQKTIEIATADAQIAKQMKEVEVKKEEAAVQEQALNAKIRKQAEAERFATEQKADADKYKIEKESEADLFRRTKEAEAELVERSKEAEAVRIAGLAEAEAIRAKGEAEANAIAAKGKAEAEAMEKKADALKKYGEAAMLQMIVEKLPEMAKAIAEPLTSIDKVTIIDGGGNGSSSGVNQMGGYVPSILAKTIESVKETTGFDLTEVMKANTIQAKTNKNIQMDAGVEAYVSKENVQNPAEKVNVAGNPAEQVNVAENPEAVVTSDSKA
jgi:flotillin